MVAITFDFMVTVVGCLTWSVNPVSIVKFIKKLCTAERSADLMKRLKVSRKTYDPPSLWSDLLLRIDAMTLTGILQIEQAACLRKLLWARDAQTADVFVNLADRADAELAAGLLSMINATRRYKNLVVDQRTRIDIM